MDWFLVCARLTVAGVFLVAAAGKLVGRSRSAVSWAEFGVPGPLIEPVSVGLPAAELLVGTGLLLAPTAQAGAMGALALLAVFTSAIVLAIRRGQAPDCHCFGSLHSEPVGAAAILRNAALAVIAAGVASQAAQPAVDGWLAQRSAGDLAILSLSAALALSIGVSGTLWRHNRALREPVSAPAPLKPLPVGSRAPAFRLEDLTGRRISLKSLLHDSSPIALLFLSPECFSCRAVLPDLSRWQVPLARDLPIHVVSSGRADQTRAMGNKHRLDRVLVDPRRAVATRYRVNHTPAALIVGPDGRVASAPEIGLPAIEALIRRALDTGSRN